jgi:hypothetical protein
MRHGVTCVPDMPTTPTLGCQDMSSPSTIPSQILSQFWDLASVEQVPAPDPAWRLSFIGDFRHTG